MLGVAAFVRGTTTVDFSGDFPILNVALPPGGAQASRSALVTGSVFQNSYNKSEVEQFQGRRTLQVRRLLRAGLRRRPRPKVENRTASAIMQRDTWGGAGQPGRLRRQHLVRRRHGQATSTRSPGHSDPRLTGQFLVFDFDRLRERAGQVAANGEPPCPTCYLAPTEYTDDIRTTENSKSAYLQYSTTFDGSMPLHVAAGVRYEQTEVESTALVRVPTSITWGSANEFNLGYAAEGTFIGGKGKYDYVLPNVDLKLDLTDNTGAARQLQPQHRPARLDPDPGRRTLRQHRAHRRRHRLTRQPGPEAAAVEQLRPVAGVVLRRIQLRLGRLLPQEHRQLHQQHHRARRQPFDLHTPVGGAYWNEALASGCGVTDMACIRNYIFANHDGDPGVTATGTNSAGQRTGTIVGQPGDPIAGFRHHRAGQPAFGPPGRLGIQRAARVRRRPASAWPPTTPR